MKKIDYTTVKLTDIYATDVYNNITKEYPLLRNFLKEKFLHHENMMMLDNFEQYLFESGFIKNDKTYHYYGTWISFWDFIVYNESDHQTWIDMYNMWRL